MGVAVHEDTAFKAILITRGRKSGTEHAVWLRAVSHGGNIYFSRRNENADWLKNAIADPAVSVQVENKTLVGTAGLVTDESLAKRISELKYPGEERAHEARITLEVQIMHNESGSSTASHTM